MPEVFRNCINLEAINFGNIDTYIKSITKSDRERELYSPITYLSNKIPKVFIYRGCPGHVENHMARAFYRVVRMLY